MNVTLDLDIDLKQIVKKMLSVISFTKVDREIIEDADMVGPVLIAIIFGFLLLLVSYVLISSEEKFNLALYMDLV